MSESSTLTCEETPAHPHISTSASSAQGGLGVLGAVTTSAMSICFKHHEPGAYDPAKCYFTVLHLGVLLGGWGMVRVLVVERKEMSEVGMKLRWKLLSAPPPISAAFP